MKLAVYTVIAGNYDKLHAVPTCAGIDFFVISNQNISIPPGWKFILKKMSDDENVITYNRKFKILGFEELNEYDYSIYIDGNIEVINSPLLLFKENIANNSIISLYDHPVRTNIYDEANEIKKIGYDYFFKINKQMKRYKNDGFISNKLYEANIIFRKHNDYNIKKAMQCWWMELKNGIKRDQLSLTYCCEKNNVKIISLGLHDARYVNHYFKYHLHLKKNKSRNLVARVINTVAKGLHLD